MPPNKSTLLPLSVKGVVVPEKMNPAKSESLAKSFVFRGSMEPVNSSQEVDPGTGTVSPSQFFFFVHRLTPSFPVQTETVWASMDATAASSKTTRNPKSNVPLTHDTGCGRGRLNRRTWDQQKNCTAGAEARLMPSR